MLVCRIPTANLGTENGDAAAALPVAREQWPKALRVGRWRAGGISSPRRAGRARSGGPAAFAVVQPCCCNLCACFLCMRLLRSTRTGTGGGDASNLTTPWFVQCAAGVVRLCPSTCCGEPLHAATATKLTIRVWVDRLELRVACSCMLVQEALESNPCRRRFRPIGRPGSTRTCRNRDRGRGPAAVFTNSVRRLTHNITGARGSALSVPARSSGIPGPCICMRQCTYSCAWRMRSKCGSFLGRGVRGVHHIIPFESLMRSLKDGSRTGQSARAQSPHCAADSAAYKGLACAHTGFAIATSATVRKHVFRPSSCCPSRTHLSVRSSV